MMFKINYGLSDNNYRVALLLKIAHNLYMNHVNFFCGIYNTHNNV